MRSWVLVDAIITLVLAILIWAHWPVSSARAIGTLVGVSLIFSGISRLMLSSTLHEKERLQRDRAIPFGLAQARLRPPRQKNGAKCGPPATAGMRIADSANRKV
jgi:hypothetical protein